jgi:sulfite reductase (NADPH) flavoprotein alpha-component
LPLTAEHARQLEALLETLSQEEALWIGGYLTAVGLHESADVSTTAAEAELEPITILYGSETGHAARVAKSFGALARDRGLEARVIDMAVFPPRELKEVTRLVVVTATHGDGAPPDAAAGLYEFLHSRKAPPLRDTSFAVLGLGDSSYEHFCQTAKDFDRRLEELGARRLHPRVDCDTDYEEQAAAWTEEALAGFAPRAGAPLIRPSPATRSTTRSPNGAAADGAHRYDRRTPFPAEIVENVAVNGRGSDKETRHVELSLRGSGLTFAPGDSLGVVAENDPALVHDLLRALGLDPDEPVAGGPGETDLARALAAEYEITTLTPRFVARYSEAAEAEELRALTGAGDPYTLSAYLAGRRIIDVVTAFPAKGLRGSALVGMLRRLEPRLYSIASSPAVSRDEAHLTVNVVRYRGHGRLHKGVASSYLAERRAVGAVVPVYVEPNENFRLPADGSAPIIMVGSGTGVAPFRAFVQERQAIGATGRSWLFFGDRRFRTDFLYQLEWLQLLREGALSRMDVAFSRDGPEKVYVQHRLRERATDVYAWLEEGAHVYVCGSADRLAPAVHETLIAVVERQGHMNRERAEEYVKTLQRERRYQRDVY